MPICVWCGRRFKHQASMSRYFQHQIFNPNSTSVVGQDDEVMAKELFVHDVGNQNRNRHLRNQTQWTRMGCQHGIGTTSTCEQT